MTDQPSVTLPFSVVKTLEMHARSVNGKPPALRRALDVARSELDSVREANLGQQSENHNGHVLVREETARNLVGSIKREERRETVRLASQLINEALRGPNTQPTVNRDAIRGRTKNISNQLDTIEYRAAHEQPHDLFHNDVDYIREQIDAIQDHLDEN